MAKSFEPRDHRGAKHKVQGQGAKSQDENGAEVIHIEIEDSDTTESEGVICEGREADLADEDFQEQWVKRMLLHQQLFESACSVPSDPNSDVELPSENAPSREQIVDAPLLPLQTLQRRLRAFAARVSVADLENIERGCSDSSGIWWRAAPDDEDQYAIESQKLPSARPGDAVGGGSLDSRSCVASDAKSGRERRGKKVSSSCKRDLRAGKNNSLRKWMAFLRFLRCLAAPPVDSPRNISGEMSPLHSDDDEHQAPLCMNRAAWGQRPSVFASYFLTKHLRYSPDSPLFSFESLKEWFKTRGGQHQGTASGTELSDANETERQGRSACDQRRRGPPSSMPGVSSEGNVNWQPPCMFHARSVVSDLRADMVRADESVKQLQPLLTFHTTWSSAKIRERTEQSTCVAVTAQRAEESGSVSSSARRILNSANETVRHPRIESAVGASDYHVEDQGVPGVNLNIERTCTVSAIVEDKVLKLNGLKPSFIARVEAAQSNIQKRRGLQFADRKAAAATQRKSPFTSSERGCALGTTEDLPMEETVLDSFEYSFPPSSANDETSSGDTSSNESEGNEKGGNKTDGRNDVSIEEDDSETEPQEEEGLVNATLPFLPRE